MSTRIAQALLIGVVGVLLLALGLLIPDSTNINRGEGRESVSFATVAEQSPRPPIMNEPSVSADFDVATFNDKVWFHDHQVFTPIFWYQNAWRAVHAFP